MSQFSTLHLLLLRHLLRRWQGNRQHKHSMCSSTTFSLSLANIPWKRLHSCKVWLADLWIGHFFVPQLARKDSPVAPAKSPGWDLSAGLRLSTFDGSKHFHSLFSGINRCLDTLIFASLSSQFANESQVDNSTNSAHLPQRRTES